MLQISLGVSGKQDVILAAGTMIQIHADCLRAIGGMYQQFQQHNPVMGGMFKDILLQALNAPECPIWKEGAVPGVGEIFSVPIPGSNGKEGGI